MKYSFGLLVMSLFTLALMPISEASAEEVWVFHLERAGDRIMLDTSTTEPVAKTDDPAFSIFDFSRATHAGPYSLDLFDVSGAKAVSTNFNMPQGKFPFKVPYFSIVNRFQVTLVKTGEVLLEGNLAEFVKCNANGICEFEKGENMGTCLTDCASGNVKYSLSTQQLLDQNNGLIRDPQTGAELLREYEPPVGMPTQTIDSDQSTQITVAKSENSRILVIVFGSIGALVILIISIMLFRRNR
ncbi:MAG: hypothetical protein HGA31_00900 [Candidatus Moranbacteria bacterium]|nr:hypothetical protein [Candidatus Moranbacteria bacterium]